jgi:hypothetical protein
MSASLAGHWEGLMHDIEGFDARVELDLNAKGTGKFAFTLVGDHCPGEPRYGEVNAAVSRDGHVKMEVGKGDVPTMHFEGRLHPVKVHARAAIAGTFSDPESGNSRGGVAIFWLYADQS